MQSVHCCKGQTRKEINKRTYASHRRNVTDRGVNYE